MKNNTKRSILFIAFVLLYVTILSIAIAGDNLIGIWKGSDSELGSLLICFEDSGKVSGQLFAVPFDGTYQINDNIVSISIDDSANAIGSMNISLLYKNEYLLWENEGKAYELNKISDKFDVDLEGYWIPDDESVKENNLSSGDLPTFKFSADSVLVKLKGKWDIGSYSRNGARVTIRALDAVFYLVWEGDSFQLTYGLFNQVKIVREEEKEPSENLRSDYAGYYVGRALDIGSYSSTGRSLENGYLLTKSGKFYVIKNLTTNVEATEFEYIIDGNDVLIRKDNYSSVIGYMDRFQFHLYSPDTYFVYEMSDSEFADRFANILPISIDVPTPKPTATPAPTSTPIPIDLEKDFEYEALKCAQIASYPDTFEGIWIMYYGMDGEKFYEFKETQGYILNSVTYAPEKHFSYEMHNDKIVLTYDDEHIEEGEYHWCTEGKFTFITLYLDLYPDDPYYMGFQKVDKEETIRKWKQYLFDQAEEEARLALIPSILHEKGTEDHLLSAYDDTFYTMPDPSTGLYRNPLDECMLIKEPTSMFGHWFTSITDTSWSETYIGENGYAYFGSWSEKNGLAKQESSYDYRTNIEFDNYWTYGIETIDDVVYIGFIDMLWRDPEQFGYKKYESRDSKVIEKHKP